MHYEGWDRGTGMNGGVVRGQIRHHLCVHVPKALLIRSNPPPFSTNIDIFFNINFLVIIVSDILITSYEYRTSILILKNCLHHKKND